MRTRGRRETVNEESPSVSGTGCRRNPGEGDFKESATEINRLLLGKVGKARVRDHRFCGNAKCHVNPTRRKIDKPIH